MGLESATGGGGSGLSSKEILNTTTNPYELTGYTEEYSDPGDNRLFDGNNAHRVYSDYNDRWYAIPEDAQDDRLYWINASNGNKGSGPAVTSGNLGGVGGIAVTDDGEDILLIEDSSDYYLYDVVNDSWTYQQNNTTFDCDYEGSTLAFGGTDFWKFGSSQDNDPQVMYRYDLSANNWSQFASLPSGVTDTREGQAITDQSQNSIYLFGAAGANNHKDVLKYNYSTDTVTKVGEVPYDNYFGNFNYARAKGGSGAVIGDYIVYSTEIYDNATNINSQLIHFWDKVNDEFADILFSVDELYPTYQDNYSVPVTLSNKDTSTSDTRFAIGEGREGNIGTLSTFGPRNPPSDEKVTNPVDSLVYTGESDSSIKNLTTKQRVTEDNEPVFAKSGDELIISRGNPNSSIVIIPVGE